MHEENQEGKRGSNYNDVQVLRVGHFLLLMWPSRSLRQVVYNGG